MNCPLSMSWRQTPQRSAGITAGGVLSLRPTAFARRTISAHAPQTWRICRNIPGLTSVMYSILEPGKYLPPHRGPYNGVLLLHLGLIVPEPRDMLGIRVENELYRCRRIVARGEAQKVFRR